jgi:hemoglobin-like flavoprotein
LTAASKELIRLSWQQLQAQSITTIERFYDRLYQRIVADDPVAKHVFHGGGIRPPREALRTTISFIISSLDQPEAVQARIYRMGVIHMIIGVQERNFATFQRDFIKTLEEFLGHDYLPLEAKEAWLILIQCIVKLILEEYTRLAKGVVIGWVWFKMRRRWKSYFATMTHTTVLFHKKDTSLLPKYSIDLMQYLNEVTPAAKKGRFDPSPYKFTIISTEKKLASFCVASPNLRDNWIFELQLRLKAINMLRQGDLYRRSLQKGHSSHKKASPSQQSAAPSPMVHRG